MLLEVVIFLWILIGTFCGVSLFYALRRINQYENFILNIQKQIQLMLDDLFEPTEGDKDAEKKEK